jgi:putative ABC transport system substrate-binding protein
VFISVGNPVGMRLVDSLPRPGRNATGFSDVLGALTGKYVEMARELIGSQVTVGYLWHTNWPDGQNRHDATVQATESLGLKLQARGVGDLAGLNDAIVEIKQSGASVIIIQPSPFTHQQRNQIIDTATNHGLATVSAFHRAGRDGAVIAYGPDYAHMYRRAGGYVERILNGTRPADLPVQEPVKFILVVNPTVANALGLTIPPSLLARADEVIE